MSLANIQVIKSCLCEPRSFEFKSSKRSLFMVQKKSPEKSSGKKEPQELYVPDKFKYQWVLKYMPSHSASCIASTYEVVSQELRRLLDNGGPKTRFTLNISDSEMQWGVLSKFEPGFISYQGYEINFFQEILKGYVAGTIRGFGSMLVLSLWLGEIDLKLANFGFVNNKGNKKIVHVDGDCSFASLQIYKAFEYGHSFNYEDINSLPLLKNYHPHNWLNSVREHSLISVRGKEREAVDKVREDNAFRCEVLKMVLYLSLLSDSIIDRFTEHYKAGCYGLFPLQSQLKQRRDIISRDLDKIKGFGDFILSDDAHKVKLELVISLITFRMYSKMRIFDLLPFEKESMPQAFHADFKGVLRKNAIDEIEQRFTDIRSLFESRSDSPDAKRQKV